MYKLAKFNPICIEKRRVLGNPPVCVFIGKRGTGKSTLVADILYHIQKIPMMIVMSGTEEGNGFYANYIHDLCIHPRYEPEVIANLIKTQKKRLREHTNPSVGLLMDDLGYNKKIFNDENLRWIFMNGRHAKITFLLTLQYCMGIPPDMRANIDYVFILRENIRTNQDKLWKHFFGVFPNFKDFQDVLNSCTNNYECLVLDNTSKSTKIEDCVFWYKAKLERKFRIGDERLWAYMSQNYRKDYDIETESAQKKVQNNATIVIKSKHRKKVSDSEDDY